MRDNYEADCEAVAMLLKRIDGLKLKDISGAIWLHARQCRRAGKCGDPSDAALPYAQG